MWAQVLCWISSSTQIWCHNSWWWCFSPPHQQWCHSTLYSFFFYIPNSSSSLPLAAWVNAQAIVLSWMELYRLGRMRVIKDNLHEPWVPIWKNNMAPQRNSPLIILLLLVKMRKIIILQAVWNRGDALVFLPLSSPQSSISTNSVCSSFSQPLTCLLLMIVKLIPAQWPKTQPTKKPYH